MKEPKDCIYFKFCVYANEDDRCPNRCLIQSEIEQKIDDYLRTLAKIVECSNCPLNDQCKLDSKFKMISK